MPELLRVALAALLLAGGLACATPDAPAAPPEPPSPGPAEPLHNWPVPPPRAELLMQTLEISGPVSDRGRPGGTTGARKLEVFVPAEDVSLAFKWKEMPRCTLDGVNNAPRKELAAYQLQKLFLEPEDYVVPTSVAVCVPLHAYAFGEKPSVPGTTCVLGVLSLWLENVTVPRKLYEKERFRSDPGYARFMANFNLFTYLFEHQDARSGNFLVSKDEARRHVFSVDNGVAMNRWPFYNWFVPNWNDIRVEGLRRESIDRLRALRREDLAPLAVVAQFEADGEGLLRRVPPGLPARADRGVRIDDGTVQLGLERGEIDGIWDRIEALLEDVAESKVPLF